MSIGNRGIDKIIAVYRAQKANGRALWSTMPVGGHPYRSARQRLLTLALSHAISVPTRRLRVMRRWWTNRPHDGRKLINRWDIAATLFGYWTDRRWICWVVLALFVFGLFATWMEGRAALRGRVLTRRQRMHAALFFKDFGRYPSTV